MLEILIFAVLLVLVVATSLKISDESERFAVFVLGRFDGLKGPGLVLKVPGPAAKWTRVRIGDRGEMVGPYFVRVGELDLPAVIEEPVSLGARVRITGFAEGAVRVAADPESARLHKCPKCGHQYEDGEI